ncbi:MAG: hypothetical protein SVU88_01550 [Candidatus Nanohaloarchaea archaeon]|nr:hypothetical protein [Candidatus Nanohaloarchaea archaeon]
MDDELDVDFRPVRHALQDGAHGTTVSQAMEDAMAADSGVVRYQLLSREDTDRAERVGTTVEQLSGRDPCCIYATQTYETGDDGLVFVKFRVTPDRTEAYVADRFDGDGAAYQ